MDSSKKILIIQSYNPNKGDNSVIEVMLSSLKQYNYDISITAFDPIKAQKDHHIKSYDYLLSFRKVKLAPNKLLFAWYAIMELLWGIYSVFYVLLYKSGIHIPLPADKKNIINAYIKADLIVLPGGHFFTSFNSLVNNFSHYYGLRYAQLLGKKTMVYSQTIGPYKDNLIGKIERIMANRVLKKADLVTLRESDSLKNYSYKNTKVTAETVFTEAIPFIDVNITKYIPNYHNEQIVGVTIHHLYYKHYFTRECYIGLMVDVFNSILERYNSRILIIPMEDNYKSGGDRPIISEMMSKIKYDFRDRINMVTDDLSSTETANIISRCNLFIGTKTHSIVYGLKTATPTLSISYQEKSTEFMKMFDMAENAIAMDKLTLNNFIEVFDTMYENQQKIKQKLQDMYPLVKKKAELNNLLLNKLINAE